MKPSNFATWSVLASLGLLLMVLPPTGASAAEPAVQVDRTVVANPDRHSFFQVGHCSVLSLVGGWDTEVTGCSTVSKATSSSSAVLVLEGAEVVRYEMTGDGELVEGAEWFAIRPGVCRGAGSQKPWHAENATMASSAPLTLCTPATHDFPRALLGSISYDGKCWETSGSGQCGTTKTCNTASESFCEATWTYSPTGGDSAYGECGGGITIEFYCDGSGVSRVRICN